MSGYFGTQMQKRLQAQAESSAEFIRMTPGACQAGRMMGCDDPDRLGWEQINAFLSRDGVCGFRLIAASSADELRSRLSERGCRFDAWDVFIADRASALTASEAILSRGLPEGLRELDSPTDPDSEFTVRIQTLMGATGVVPFSGSLLAGIVGPAVTPVVGDLEGNVVAAAHGYLPHNIHSNYQRHAWGGLVAVDETRRGFGLGSYINAWLIARVFRELDATHIYELVSSTNIVSRRMVEACGLRHTPSLVCGLATSNDNARFTR